MKKQIVQTLILSLVSCQLLAQTNIITRQVISAGGRNTVLSISCTFGEAVIGTTTIKNGYVTQGFQQPLDFGIQTSNQAIEPPLNATLYPNPSSGIISIAIDNTNSLVSLIHVYNAFGQLIQTVKSQDQLIHLDLSNNVAGVYLIRVSQKGKRDFTKQVVLQK